MIITKILLNLNYVISIEQTQTKINDKESYGLIEDENFGQTYCEALYPTSTSYIPLEHKQLLLVHLMTRHGDRSSIFTVDREDINSKTPFDCPSENINIETNNDISYTQDNNLDCNEEGYCSVNSFIQNRIWKNTSCTLGQLTKKGSKQLMSIGKELRVIYTKNIDFLSSNTDILKQIYTRSTDFHRTKQSAASLLRTLTDSPSKKIIHTVNEMFETISPHTQNCKKLKILTKNITELNTFKEFNANFEKHKKRILEILRSKIEIVDYEVFIIEALLDITWSRHCSKFPKICHPNDPNECIDDNLLETISKYSNIEARILNKDNVYNIPSAARLRIGGFLLELKRNLLQKINPNLIKNNSNNLSEYKFLYFSAHDSSLSALLGALQSFDMRWPPYASNMVIELWKDNVSTKNELEDHFIRFIYNGKPLLTSWCNSQIAEGTCSVKDFMTYLDETLYIIGGFENYKRENKYVWNQYNECHST